MALRLPYHSFLPFQTNQGTKASEQLSVLKIQERKLLLPKLSFRLVARILRVRQRFRFKNRYLDFTNVGPNALKRNHTQPVTNAERGKTTPRSSSLLEAIQRALNVPPQMNSPG
jgi:hypothetical protein